MFVLRLDVDIFINEADPLKVSFGHKLGSDNEASMFETSVEADDYADKLNELYGTELTFEAVEVDEDGNEIKEKRKR